MVTDVLYKKCFLGIFFPSKILFTTFRLKNAYDVVDAFNVDPLYLKHAHQGQAPDYRVNIFCHLLKKMVEITFAFLALANTIRQKVPFAQIVVRDARLWRCWPQSAHPPPG